MWFKNLIIFKLDQQLELEDATLDECLGTMAFKPCAPQQATSIGWVAPAENESETLFHRGSGQILLTARREERVMPPGAVKQAVDDKVAQIEQRQEHKLGRKQKMEIREDMVFSMMPRAFTRSARIQGMIMPELGLLVVDCANRGRAEEWLTLLRQSLGSLVARPVQTRKSLPALFTAWLNGKASLPQSIEPGDECELQSVTESRALVSCRRQDLQTEEVASHLRAGKQVTRIGLEWKGALSFVLNEHAEIKRLRFSDTLVEQAASDGAADRAAEFDARYTLMALELARFLPALFDELGGIESE